MNITSKRSGGELTISLFGELDHHSARCAIPEISRIIDIELPLKLILDFSGISFMDSSGIAIVIGSYKKATVLGATFAVLNVPGQAYKVFSAAGICKMISITSVDASLAKI